MGRVTAVVVKVKILLPDLDHPAFRKLKIYDPGRRLIRRSLYKGQNRSGLSRGTGKRGEGPKGLPPINISVEDRNQLELGAN